MSAPHKLDVVYVGWIINVVYLLFTPAGKQFSSS
jgi:hypothetical protein